ncbi:unnamed protein product [Cuscuta campestris]|uniref:Reverse transcriptase Ty1/copia-type domain-containing protein n=1 Tax=Cuscuta campestris TaxID=132261 RepID=A0A484LD71_9ASTE|nr:unnamed protein product [Cuscuta campestris]
MAESEVTSNTTPEKTPHLDFTTISNVKLYVPVFLSLSQPNYKKWSRLFLLLVRRFNLQGYINGSIAPLSEDDDEWLQLDALLQGLILSTISDEVSDLVISSVSTASALWKVIHDLFHDNKNARAMQLEHEFRTTVKGNTTMAAYCQHRQNLADWLDDVDAPVSQHQLVLQMLRGLPADLQAQTSFFQFQDPLPTFLQARSALMLLDRKRSPMAEAGGTALLAGRPGGNGGTSSTALLQHLIQRLEAEFAMTDMGDLHFFLGINVHRTTSGLFLHQTQFTHDILERARMVSCRPISTPVDTKAKLSSSSVSWSSKRQATTSRYSAESEYCAVANAVAETSWIPNLLLELQQPLRLATLVFCDNGSAVYLSTNPVQHQRTKHVEVDIHFARDKVALGHVRVLHVSLSSQYVDIFTKGLSSLLFLDFRQSLGTPPHST